MTFPRFEEPHPPTPLSASREGGSISTRHHLQREGSISTPPR
jgi:hypothetical protein